MNDTKWRDQCDAARGIRESFGVAKALGYLVGEKFITFLRISDRLPAWRDELPTFSDEIRSMFTPSELTHYFATVRHTGPAAHVLDADGYAFMAEAAAYLANPTSLRLLRKPS
jgi:hypothetical protein